MARWRFRKSYNFGGRKVVGVLTSIFLFNTNKLEKTPSVQTDVNIESQLASEYSRGYQDGLLAGSISTESTEIKTDTSNETSSTSIDMDTSIKIVKLSSLDYFANGGVFKPEYNEQVKIITGDYLDDCYMFDCYSSTTVDYLLDFKYTKLEGPLFLSYKGRSTSAIGRINIYGDNKCIYQSDEIKNGFLPTPFEVDINNVKILKIEYECISIAMGGNSLGGFSNVVLHKS